MKELPRIDLRESAFRKYEHTIAKASYGKVVVVPEGKKAQSYIARFRDAVRGYRLYSYSSTLIPPGCPLEFRLAELEDGSVEITPRWDVTAKRSGTPAAGDVEGVKELCRKLVVGEVTGPVAVTFLAPEEKAFLLSLPSFYDVAVSFDGEGCPGVGKIR